MGRSRERSGGEALGNRRSGPGLSILSGISGAALPTSVLRPTRTRRPRPRWGESLASLRGALLPVAAAPEPGCAGRDSACEARCLGSRQPETVHQGLVCPGLSAPSQPIPWVAWNRTSGLGGGERGFYCSRPNLQQQANSPHALLPGGIFSNRSSKPAPHRPLSVPGTRSPLCLLNRLSRDRDWRTCSKRALHLLFPRLLLIMAFPCKVSRNRANENVGGKVLVLSLLSSFMLEK